MGTDISELLMRDHHGDFGLLASPNERRLMQIKGEWNGIKMRLCRVLRIRACRIYWV